MEDQRHWPAHLRDDAPFAVCGGCGRHSWDRRDWGRRCLFPQPDGAACNGTFDDPSMRRQAPPEIRRFRTYRCPTCGGTFVLSRQGEQSHVYAEDGVHVLVMAAVDADGTTTVRIGHRETGE